MTKSAWILVAIGGVLVVGGIGFAAWRMTHTADQGTSATSSSANPVAGSRQGSGQGRSGGSQAQSSGSISWSFTGTAWQASGTPPSCPNPMLPSLPTDLTNVTSILYPGQPRGGNYKPHGGFRFDHQPDNSVTVTLPIDAQLVDGGRYLVGGETQYLLDFVAPCGIQLRFGHLKTISSDLQKIVDQFPAPVEGDSRTTQVNPPAPLAAGTTLATAVGVSHDPISSSRDVFFDFGVFDLRSKNAASQSASWQSNHADDQQLAPYALCWLDTTVVSADLSTKLKALPAGDPQSGKTSDYCK